MEGYAGDLQRCTPAVVCGRRNRVPKQRGRLLRAQKAVLPNLGERTRSMGVSARQTVIRQ